MTDPLPELRYPVQGVVRVARGNEDIRVKEAARIMYSRFSAHLAVRAVVQRCAASRQALYWPSCT
jgi:hypothetical protein